jgi:hypothetical protein
MFQITIPQRAGGVQVVLWYKTSSSMTEQLTAAQEKFHAFLVDPIPKKNRDLFTIRDDFGHVAKIDPANVAFIVSTDLVAEGKGHEEKTILTNRAAKKLQDRQRMDPVLNMATSAPGLIS